MRTIKFRGLPTDGKGWVYGYYYEYSSKHIICWQNHSDNATTDHFAEVIAESVGQLIHTERNGREWYKGDVARINIEVPPTSYHDGNGWLNNDDGFEGYAIGEVIFHNKFGLCITNYTLTDWNTEEIISHKVKYKTIPVTRSEIIGSIHTTPELLNPSN